MKVENASIHVAMSSMRRFNFLGPEVNTKHPSNNSCGSGSVSTMLVDKSLSNSTNFLDTICVTIFVGIGENPGLTTNGWWRIGAGLAADGVSTMDWGEKAATDHAQDNTSEVVGGANVDMKDGTTKAGLLWEDKVDASGDCSKKPVPEASKADAWAPKSWPGTPPSTGDEEQLVPTTATLAGNEDDCESEPGGASAAMEALLLVQSQQSNLGIAEQQLAVKPR